MPRSPSAGDGALHRLGILDRIGLGKLSRLEPLEPANRYERRRAGELIHIDVKKLVRIDKGGRAQDDRQAHPPCPWRRLGVRPRLRRRRTRLAYVEVLGDEKARSAVGFLRRAIAFYRSHGIEAEGVMTDNGPAYVSIAHAIACRALGVRHIRTRPYRPQTNGKACVLASRCRPPGRRGSPRLRVLLRRKACRGERRAPIGALLSVNP